MRRTILDFTGIYRNQETLRAEAQEYLDLSRMQGTDCYCDPETEKKLREMLRKVPEGGIHLMDSGNYHYMSKLFLGELARDVSLVVLDHHTDMQPPALLPILSCGSWLADKLRDVPGVRQTFLIGPPLEALEQIPMEYRGRVSWISMEELEDGSWKKKLSGFHADFPVYFSVDKDVFSPQVCSTNWDQGTMRLEEMTGILGWFRSQGETTGVDLCGEPDPVRAKEREIARSMDVNRILMSFWLDK